MSGINLTVEGRKAVGKKEIKAIRRDGFVPGVLYGRGQDAVPLRVDAIALFKHLRDIGKSKLVQLDSDEKSLSGKHVMIREVQKDVVSEELLHVDLQAVDLDQQIAVSVPINYIGTSAGEKAGGARNVRMYYVKVLCRADSIPEQIDINIEAMEIGDVLRAGMVELAEGVSLDVAEEITVIAIERRRQVVLPEPGAAPDEAAEEDGVEEEAEGGEEEAAASDEG